MQFRDHPLMTRKSGIRSWPPSWTSIHHDRVNKREGEIGVLTHVLKNEFIDNKIFMFIEYSGVRYSGMLIVEDAAFCDTVFNLLQSNLGRSIKEIGDLDVGHTL
jgi:hypothetical protein